MAYPIGGAKPWYTYKYDSDFGKYPDPLPGANYPKPDANVRVPKGQTITCVGAGVVTGVRAQPWGPLAYSITVRLDKPYNTVATHMAYNYVTSPVVSVGDRVAVGDPLASAGNSYGIYTAFAFIDTDIYGAGSANEPFTGTYVNPLLSPVPFLDSLNAGAPGGSGSGANNPAQVVTNALTPNSDVTALLYTLDQMLVLNNPFQISGVQQDSIAGLSFTDPVAWASQAAQNIVDDMAALTMRLIFLLLGLFVMYKVFSAFIDFGAVSKAAAGVVQTSAILSA